jgi:hypothetical protein
LTPQILEALFPGADKLGEVGGSPPAASVSKGGHRLGYVFSTWDVTQSKGFSNRPLILLVGVDLTGHVTAGSTVSGHTRKSPGLHSIRSSARESTEDGTVRPSSLAAVKLIASSNLVGK